MTRENYHKHVLALAYVKDIMEFMSVNHYLDFVDRDEQIEEVCSLYSAFITNDFQYVIDGLEEMVGSEYHDEDTDQLLKSTIMLLEDAQKRGTFA